MWVSVNVAMVETNSSTNALTKLPNTSRSGNLKIIAVDIGFSAIVSSGYRLVLNDGPIIHSSDSCSLVAVIWPSAAANDYVDLKTFTL